MKSRIVQRERRSHPSDRGRHRAATYTALIVINSSGEVKSTFADAGRTDAVARFVRDGGARLIPEIESAVMTLMDGLADPETAGELLAVLDDGSTMRLSPLLSSGDKMYALVVENDRNEDCIARAVSRYRLTNRQTDVLLHVLEGANAGDVARALQISEYTAQGYIKALLTKTESRNRTAMVAKVLEWPTSGPKRERRTAPRAARSLPYT